MDAASEGHVGALSSWREVELAERLHTMIPCAERVQLLGAGTILREVLAAAEILEKDYQVPADVWSVTSFSELRRDGLDCERWIPGRYAVLGTDGYGRSDSRAALREFFEVDRKYIVVAALKALADDGSLDPKTVAKAIEALGIDPSKPNPVTV
mgnify:CR=1 FL=1